MSSRSLKYQTFRFELEVVVWKKILDLSRTDLSKE